MDRKLKIIDQITALEWWQFQGVKNQGGRASCQDDQETFMIMRKSQFMAWDVDVVESYYEDIKNARDVRRNLLTEKYGRMMESTAPAEYVAMKHRFPVIDDATKTLIEEAVAINVKWDEAFAKRYPRLAGSGRSIHTSEDTPWNTSMETYARGELGTYSPETVRKYRDMCVRKLENGENMAEQTMYYMVKFYGYDTIDEAEAYA